MTSIWHKDYSIEEVNLRGENTLVNHLGIQITEITDSSLSATMPVDHTTVQPARILHGGASCVLAESLGSIAANMVIDTHKFIAVGQSITANHLRPGLEGETVLGIAKALHTGRRSQLWNIDIFNEKEQMICSSRLTMAIIEK